MDSPAAGPGWCRRSHGRRAQTWTWCGRRPFARLGEVAWGAGIGLTHSVGLLGRSPMETGRRHLCVLSLPCISWLAPFFFNQVFSFFFPGGCQVLHSPSASRQLVGGCHLCVLLPPCSSLQTQSFFFFLFTLGFVFLLSFLVGTAFTPCLTPVGGRPL